MAAVLALCHRVRIHWTRTEVDTTAILIIEDHAVVRRGLKHFLAEALPGAIVEEAPNAATALVQLASREFQLVILDLFLPGKGGLEFVSELHSAFPKTPILVLSTYSENEFAVRSLRAGASGYLHKGSSRQELVRAMRRVMGGGRYLSDTMAEQIAVGATSPAPEDRLSNREYEVLRGIAAGKKQTELARELSMSTKTVSTHKRRIMMKLNLASNAELIRFAMRHELDAKGLEPLP
ncbi:MAG: response regulator transcription factor [Bryobacteraceae bacterium]|jgi:DNA-binding NarL/FixJ family response regulator